MKILSVLLLCATAAAQLPDAPQPQPIAPPAQVKFFTFRGNPNKAALRTNRQELTSKLFLASCGALWAAVITDVTYTGGKRENAGSEYPAAAGACGLMYIGDRFFTRSFMVGPAVYGIQHYVRDALRGK